MSSRFCSSCIAALLLLGSSTTAFAAGFGESNLIAASDESGREFEVGARLVATNEVKLRDVTLSKGARITIRAVEQKGSRVASFDVELADGQVLKRVDAAAIYKSFVAAND